VNRPGTRLILLAGVLVALVFIFANPFQDRIRGKGPEREALFDRDRVLQADRIEIRNGAATPVILQDQGGDWVVASRNGFPADTAAVGTMLRAVGGARSTGVASRNPANRSKFQVDSTGVRVTLSKGTEPLASITVGKMGQDFTTSYVRNDDGEEVLVVRGVNRNIFTRPQGYRDRTLLAFDPNNVQSVTAKLPEGGWQLTRQDSAWTLAHVPAQGEPERADGTAVDQTLRGLSTFSADGFLDAGADTAQTGLDAPETEFSVHLMNGTDLEVSIGNKNGRNQRYAKRPDREVVYTLGDWRVTNVAKKYEDLVAKAPKTPPAPPPAPAGH